MKEAYKNKRYSILCISDHEYPMVHSYLTDDDFLILTGYEAYIRPSPEAIMQPYEPEIHLNLFSKEPQNETYICYDEPYAKYIKRKDGRLDEYPKLLLLKTFQIFITAFSSFGDNLIAAYAPPFSRSI